MICPCCARLVPRLPCWKQPTTMCSRLSHRNSLENFLASWKVLVKAASNHSFSLKELNWSFHVQGLLHRFLHFLFFNMVFCRPKQELPNAPPHCLLRGLALRPASPDLSFVFRVLAENFKTQVSARHPKEWQRTAVAWWRSHQRVG